MDANFLTALAFFLVVGILLIVPYIAGATADTARDKGYRWRTWFWLSIGFGIWLPIGGVLIPALAMACLPRTAAQDWQR